MWTCCGCEGVSLVYGRGAKKRTGRVATFGGFTSPVVMASHIRSASALPKIPSAAPSGATARLPSKEGTVMRGESHRADDEGSSKREMRFSSL